MKSPRGPRRPPFADRFVYRPWFGVSGASEALLKCLMLLALIAAICALGTIFSRVLHAWDILPSGLTTWAAAFFAAFVVAAPAAASALESYALRASRGNIPRKYWPDLSFEQDGRLSGQLLELFNSALRAEVLSSRSLSELRESIEQRKVVCANCEGKTLQLYACGRCGQMLCKERCWKTCVSTCVRCGITACYECGNTFRANYEMRYADYRKRSGELMQEGLHCSEGAYVTKWALMSAEERATLQGLVHDLSVPPWDRAWASRRLEEAMALPKAVANKRAHCYAEMFLCADCQASLGTDGSKAFLKKRYRKRFRGARFTSVT
jgi:hypothetical protein